MTDTPEFRDRGKRTFELVVHRNFVTEFRDYHFGTLELVTLVHQNNNKIQLGWDYHDQVGAYRRTGILGKEWVLSRVSCEPGEEAGGDGAHVLVNAATYLRICQCR